VRPERDVDAGAFIPDEVEDSAAAVLKRRVAETPGTRAPRVEP